MAQNFAIEDIQSFDLPDKISSNPRLSREALEYKRIANQFLSYEDSKSLIQSLVHYSIAEKESGRDCWGGMIISPEHRRELLESVKGQVNEIRGAFFPGRETDLFDGDLQVDHSEPSEFLLPSLSMKEAQQLSKSLIQRSFPYLTLKQVTRRMG